MSASGGDTPDPGDTRDSLRFGPSSNLNQDNFRLSGPNNPAENFFASQINGDDGRLDTSGTFGRDNNDFAGRTVGGRQGWDITNVDASAQLSQRQRTAFAQGTADADDFFINALAMQIDVAAPGFWDTRNQTSVNRSTAEVGDVLTYTVELDNRSGLTSANNVVLTVPLPAGMSFVAGSFTLDGTPTGANPITGAAVGTVAVNARREVTFQLRVDAIPAAPAPARYQVTPTWTYTFVGLRGQDTAVGRLHVEHGEHGNRTHHRHQISFRTIDSAGRDPDLHHHDLELRHGGEQDTRWSGTPFQPVQRISRIRRRSTETRSPTCSEPRNSSSACS